MSIVMTYDDQWNYDIGICETSHRLAWWFMEYGIMTYGSSLVNWLRSNCNSNACSHLGISWYVIFPFGVWSIWLHRNKVVFRGNDPPKLNSYEVITKAAEFAFLGVNGKNVRVKTTVQVRWTSPRCSGLNSIRMDLQWATRAVRVEEASLGMRRVSGSKGMRDLLETWLALLLNCGRCEMEFNYV